MARPAEMLVLPSQAKSDEDEAIDLQQLT